MAQGSTGNVIAALASFILPGLGQLLQGRVLPAIFFFCLHVLWIVGLGWIANLVACIDAAIWKGSIKTSL